MSTVPILVALSILTTLSFILAPALGVSIEELSHIVEVPEDIHLATKDERESAVILVGSAGQGDLAVVERVLDRYPYIVSIDVLLHINYELVFSPYRFYPHSSLYIWAFFFFMHCCFHIFISTFCSLLKFFLSQLFF